MMKKEEEESGSPNQIKYSIWDTATNQNQPLLTNGGLTQSNAEDDDKAWEDDRI